MNISNTFLSVALLLLAGSEQKLCRAFHSQPIPTVINSSTSRFFNKEDEYPSASSFHQRMLDRLKSPEKDSNGNPYIQEIETLADFRRVITEADDHQKLVVACFYSPWCRACRALAPGFTALAKRNGGMTFIQVPATEKNANLHNGLGVPSVPYVQVYHPQAGLVESQKLIRFLLPGFQKVLKDYELGSCSLVHDKSGEWSTSNPNERSKG